MNIFNSRAASVYGLTNYVNSVESDIYDTKDGYIYSSDKVMVMTLTHCPVQLSTKCTCSTCKYNNGLNYKTNSLSMRIEREKVGYCYFNMFLDKPINKKERISILPVYHKI